jgi:acetolactate synthase-1/2/3 large subunit
LSCPDFEDVAECFALKYLRALTLVEFKNALQQAMKLESPIMIEVQGVTNQEYVQIARKKDSSGKLLRMPIENQFPFVDRPKFLEVISSATKDQSLLP